MPTDQLLLLAAGLAVIAAVAVTVAWATSHRPRRDSIPGPDQPGTAAAGRDLTGGAEPASMGPINPRPGSFFIAPASTRQVARVVAFLFLAAVAVVVALTDAWPERQAAIFTLLAAGTLLVVVFMDMVPPPVMGRWRRPAEGIGAILFLGFLIALTGGVGSPFFVGFFLVVAGTSLSTEGRAPLFIALAAAATIAVASLVVSVDEALAGQGLAWIGFNAVALILLADIATAAARAQRHARDEALRASRFDALTGLFNRAFFFTTMEQEIRRSDRMGRGFTMLMLDLDDLKPVNDTFGHQWGDRLLKAIADVVRHTIRFTDSAARYGGDEFVVLLPETDAAGGFVVAEKLRRDIAALTLHAADRNVRSSVSVGLVTYPHDGSTIEQLVAAADVAMYESKRRGKNRIVGYQTRTERVATAMDGDAADLVQLTPADDARTGGDPAPWEVGGTPGRPSSALGARADDVSSIPIEPDTRTRSGEPTPSGEASTRGRAPWDPLEPPARQPRSEPPAAEPRRSMRSPQAGPGDADARTIDQPWLTRTGDAGSGATGGDGRGSADGDRPPQRPAASAGSSEGPGSGGRGQSRSDEIRSSGERPWIALPIEPFDPRDRPRS